jgi:hypothetical protein
VSLASWFSKLPDDELTPEQREQIARLEELREQVPTYSAIYEIVAVYGIADALGIFSRISGRMAEDEQYTNCRRCRERLSMISHELSKLADFAGIACEGIDAQEDGE